MTILGGLAQATTAWSQPSWEEALGHLVERAAALQGVHPAALLRLLRRLQTQHVLQQVQEAAAGVGGQAAGGDGRARGGGVEPLRDGLGDGVDQALVGGGEVVPARARRGPSPAKTYRPRQPGRYRADAWRAD